MSRHTRGGAGERLVLISSEYRNQACVLALLLARHGGWATSWHGTLGSCAWVVQVRWREAASVRHWVSRPVQPASRTALCPRSCSTAARLCR
jgi:hypothetical protein